MSLFPLPKRAPALDSARRRSPPSPLRLGAAYQKKVIRGHQKFTEPQALTSRECHLIDSACDKIVRSAVETDGQWDAASSTNSISFCALRGSDSSDSHHTQWSIAGSETVDEMAASVDGADSPPASGGGRSGGSESSSSSSGHRIRAQHHHRSHCSASSLFSSNSPISYPALCRIEQSGSRHYSHHSRQQQHQQQHQHM